MENYPTSDIQIPAKLKQENIEILLRLEFLLSILPDTTATSGHFHLPYSP
jgi:hypothetical protein